MGRGRAPVSGDIDAKTLHNYSEDKVDGVRLATPDAPPPTFTCAPAGCMLHSFRPLAGDNNNNNNNNKPTISNAP